jgi:hypothetical protein
MRRIAVVLFVAFAGLAAAAVALVHGPGPDASQAASHREAPLISLDPSADISDFFMFRSYEPGRSDKVVLLMDVNPGSEPSSGPNYWNFDPNVRYEFNVDNDTDGRADDVQFFVRFKTEFRGIPADLKLPLAYVGGKTLPPITSLDGPGSEGIGLRQRYTVTMVKNGVRQTLAAGLLVVPSNVGPRTMPAYESLAAQGIHELDGGIRVFAGQRQDPFYIDLGGVFDTLNLRRDPPVLTPAEDENDNANPFGIDHLAGFNVSSIALEVPASVLTKDGRGPGGTAAPNLGAYASTSRQKVRVLGGPNEGPWVQVQRLANPLVNETVVGTIDKDRWNSLDPEDEAQFLDYYLNPRLALALQVIVGVPAATSGRQDLVDLLLKYRPSDEQLSELLRLDVSVPPTPLAAQRRMGPLAATPDPASWPNGRRPRDDVTDIAVRVVGGPNYIAARAGDGVNVDDVGLTTQFPFLAVPSDGRDRVHQP